MHKTTVELKLSLTTTKQKLTWKKIENLISGIESFCESKGYLLDEHHMSMLSKHISEENFITEEDIRV